jgi:hypothetical protein
MLANHDKSNQAVRLLSRLQYLVHELRLQPEDRMFYVPLILDFHRMVQGTLPAVEAENILEAAVARIMRHEYTSVGSMLKSLTKLLQQKRDEPQAAPATVHLWRRPARAARISHALAEHSAAA